MPKRDFMEVWAPRPLPRLSSLHACSRCGECIDIVNDPYLVVSDGERLCLACSATATIARDTWWRRLRLWWRDRRDPHADWVDEARCTRAWERDGGYGR